MRDGNIFNLRRALPRMVGLPILSSSIKSYKLGAPFQSWSSKNLYNLWNRSAGPLAEETNFTKSALSLFQQRWRSKRFVRAYHGDWVSETTFKRWYLPERLPDVRVRHAAADIELSKWSLRDGDVKSVMKQKKAAADAAASTPVGSLMFMEIERRLDVFVFRCCFATSAYQARQLIVHGKVKLNGVKVSVSLYKPAC